MLLYVKTVLMCAWLCALKAKKTAVKAKIQTKNRANVWQTARKKKAENNKHLRATP